MAEFIREKKVGKYSYFQVVRSVREGAKVKQRVLCHLGKYASVRDALNAVEAEIDSGRENYDLIKQQKEEHQIQFWTNAGLANGVNAGAETEEGRRELLALEPPKRFSSGTLALFYARLPLTAAVMAPYTAEAKMAFSSYCVSRRALVAQSKKLEKLGKRASTLRQFLHLE